jgi:zinc protease
MSAVTYVGAPPAGAAVAGSDWIAPGTVRTTLANGVRAVFAEDHAVPVAFLSFTARAGFDRDPKGLEGLASLTPLVLREGTAARSGDALTRALDDLGATMSVGSDWDGAFLTIALLSSDVADGLDLLLDQVFAPACSPAAIARLRQRRLAELERRRRDSRVLATDAFAAALFGDTVYGRASLGTTASVQRIDDVAVRAFHNAHYRASASYFGVAGSFDPTLVIDRLGAVELPLRASLPETPPALSVDTRAMGVRVVDVPGAPQTEIRVGHAGVARDCADLPALDVLNAILGGGPGSRLARRVRQQLGLAYHVRSRFAAHRFGGTFLVETSVANETAAAAVGAIRGEIERLRDELVPVDELEQARRRLFGAALTYLQDLIGTGLRIGRAALDNDSDYLERRAPAVAAVDPERLRELARRYLNPERLLAVVAGPAATLQRQFSSDAAPVCVPLESTS